MTRFVRGIDRRTGFTAAARHFAAHVVEHAAGSHLNQPGSGIIGDAFAWPLHGRGKQGLLHGVFGGGEITEAADHCAEHLRRELAQQVLEVSAHSISGGGALITGRTSMGMFNGTPPGPGAADAPAAIS